MTIAINVLQIERNIICNATQTVSIYWFFGLEILLGAKTQK